MHQGGIITDILPAGCPCTIHQNRGFGCPWGFGSRQDLRYRKSETVDDGVECSYEVIRDGGRRVEGKRRWYLCASMVVKKTVFLRGFASVGTKCSGGDLFPAATMINIRIWFASEGQRTKRRHIELTLSPTRRPGTLSPTAWIVPDTLNESKVGYSFTKKALSVM